MTNSRPVLRNNNSPKTPPKPSPWIGEVQPQPCKEASFVEYLRWMRAPSDKKTKDATKVQLLQKAVKTSHYPERLKILTQRTRALAKDGLVLEVQSPWRLRVGGQKGPESTLLPSFDASGIPFIPSTSLRGIARAQAIQDFMTEKHISWEKAEKLIAPFFGDLDAKQPQNRMGKVIFFDAYPLPTPSPKQKINGGLAVDIVNNIWQWEGDRSVYNPSPNVFLSLSKPTFVIGLRGMRGCPSETLNKIKEWLVKGLQTSGAGGQINSGYGTLQLKDNGQGIETPLPHEFFRVEFTLEGQFIHGVQEIDDSSWRLNDRGEWTVRGKAKEEVRPIAFKSMLRYWFRALALGVCDTESVKQVESEIFGGIQPKSWGLLKVEILNGNSNGDEQSGTVVLSRSTNMERLPAAKIKALEEMLTNLIWISFRLGGVGQGARRPRYFRDSIPKQRGVELSPAVLEGIWEFPDTSEILRDTFQQFLGGFYRSLASFSGISVVDAQSNALLRDDSPQAEPSQWLEVVDRHCQIVIVAGNSKHPEKNYALDLLHQQFHKYEKTDKTQAKNLCGGTVKDSITINQQRIERKAIPSPIWMVDFGDFQVVTVFGATANPRKLYLQELIKSADQHFYIHRCI